MYDRTLAIYCFIDDLLKAMQHTEDSRAKLSDSEVVTTAIVAMLFFGGNFERSRSFLHASGMMPRMLSRSRLSRRLSRLAELIEVIFHQLGLTLKELNYEWEDYLCEQDRVRLLVARKQNSKRRDPLAAHDYKQWLHRRIETVFGEMTKLFPKKIHATTLSGFLLKISLFLFAYQVDQAFI
jgi:hypothetical protein